MTLLAILAAAAVTTTPSADVATQRGSMGVQFQLPGNVAEPTVGLTYFMNDNMAVRFDFGLNAQPSPSGVPVTFSLGGGVRLYQFKRDSVAVFLYPSFTLARVAPAAPGADATIAAGPKGRTASADTDAYMRAEMLSYSRARGVFAGISLEGSTLRPDKTANRRLYGKQASAQKIVLEARADAPPAGAKLVGRLQKASPQLKR